MSLDESRFHALAGRSLDALAQAVDRDLGDELDVDVEGGILTIGLPGGGQYILNANAPLRQLWLASPKSGAWHFDWNEEEAVWLSTRHDHVEMAELLFGELEAVTGTRPSF
ncbi:MAG: iron donor protein CyaY [Rhodospirillaceae bacterium]|nr:iron donor protein CyaY [Rhodospirillaceae bacterium]